MLAGLTGQPGSHSLSVTRRSWSSPGNSAALTASLSRFSPGQMKCSLDFRLVASFYGLRRTDNHPGLPASSPALNPPSTRISLAASARRKICPHPKVDPAGTASSIAALRRLAPVVAFDQQPRFLPLRLAPFSAPRFHSTDIVRLFWLAQHCFQCLARCCSPVPPPAFTDCGFRRPGCNRSRVPGRNQGRSPNHTAETSSAFPCRSEERQRSAALTPATLQPYDFHRLAAGPFPVRNSRSCLASEQAFQLTLTQARLRVPTGATHIHSLRSNS